jgi:hypothetical protein
VGVGFDGVLAIVREGAWRSEGTMSAMDRRFRGGTSLVALTIATLGTVRDR